MSPFAQLLTEAQSILRTRHRRTVGLHFDWDGDDGPTSWKAWHDGEPIPVIHTGQAGEQALRRLVDALKGAA